MVYCKIKGQPSSVSSFDKKGNVTVPGHLNDEIAKGTLSNIFKQAKLKK
jgi:predicted RNA binding protein YcfA (HicA-like mRNA interferase family)